MILTTVKIDDFDRWWNTFSTKEARKRKQDPGPRVRTPSAIRTTSPAPGRFSTGTRRAFRTSCPIPTFRRSFKKRGSKVGPKLRNSPASATHRPRSRIGSLEASGLSE